MGIALLLVFLLGGFLIWQVQGIYVTSLRSELQNRGLSLARYLAARSEDLILTDKLFALHELAADAVVKNEDVRYVLFLDAEGRLLVDTFNNGLPEGLLQLNTLPAGQAFSLKSFRSEEGVIHDLAVPVLEGKGGALRLGLAETRLSRAVAALKFRLWAITILVSLLGVGVAYALASTLTAPLREL